MINLLPLKEKQKLFFKKQEKLAMVLGIIVSVFLVCLILVLSSIKFCILAKEDFQKNTLRQTEKEAQSSDFITLNSVVQKYNRTLVQLNAFYGKETYFNRALKIISDVPSPADVYFTNFSFKRNESGNIQASISGISGTREDLLVFKKNIEGDSKIRNPFFSPDSWIDPKNANFSLTFEIDQNGK